jgi:hypothetical protein
VPVMRADEEAKLDAETERSLDEVEAGRVVTPKTTARTARSAGDKTRGRQAPRVNTMHPTSSADQQARCRRLPSSNLSPLTATRTTTVLGDVGDACPQTEAGAIVDKSGAFGARTIRGRKRSARIDTRVRGVLGRTLLVPQRGSPDRSGRSRKTSARGRRSRGLRGRSPRKPPDLAPPCPLVGIARTRHW